jgi:nitrogen regulatory protein PII
MMKCYIQYEKLVALWEKLFYLGVPGVSVVDSNGIGKPMSDLKSDPVLKVPQFHPCGETSVVLEAEAVGEVVDMIEKTLHTSV